MSISVERLRRWMLAAVVVLAAVVGGYIWLSRHASRILTNVAKAKLQQMGIDVVESTDDYTVSQSAGPGGKTIWTIHASKAIHHKDGMVILQKANVILYGRKQDREDRISGDEFQYDTKTETIQAAGEVHIDLQAPAKTGTKPQGTNAADGEGPDVIHIKTTGLVYKKDLGVAATPNALEFQIRGFQGNAVGAEYNSDTGLLILESQVHASGVANGRPVQLEAARAELNRSDKAVLKQARFSSQRPGQKEPEKASAQEAIVMLRQDGSPQHIDASGDVTLEPGNGRTVHSAKLAMDLNAAGRPTTAHGFGGVKFVDDEPLRKADGTAEDAQIAFDEQGRAKRMKTTGHVAMTQRSRATATAPWTNRTLNATEVETAFVPVAGTKQSQVSEAWANGSAKLTMQAVQAAQPAHGNVAARAAVTTTTTMTSDRMDAKLLGNADGLAHLHGEGDAEVLQAGSDGMQTDNKGDVMDVTFHGLEQAGGAAKPGAGDSSGGLNGVVNAALTGHVTIQRTDVKASLNGKGAAGRVEYDASQDHVTLIDHAQWASAGRMVWANRITLTRSTGDAEAQGGVKATLVRDGAPAGADVTHVVADRGIVHQTAQRAEFFGSTSVPVRMWQGGSQIEAPVLILEQEQQRLTAHGDGGAGLQVHSVFANTDPASNSNPSKNGKKTPTVMRIASHEMTYSDTTRQGIFTGGVQMETGDGIVTAQRGDVWLEAAAAAKSSTLKPVAPKPAASQPSAPQTGMFDGSVERAVASGRVRLTQPGKHGSGEQLVYTASDQKFVLTGTPTDPPSLTDVKGTTQGASLIFHAGDDSVEIQGGPAEEVHTQTRSKPRRQSP